MAKFWSVCRIMFCLALFAAGVYVQREWGPVTEAVIVDADLRNQVADYREENIRLSGRIAATERNLKLAEADVSTLLAEEGTAGASVVRALTAERDRLRIRVDELTNPVLRVRSLDRSLATNQELTWLSFRFDPAHPQVCYRVVDHMPGTPIGGELGVPVVATDFQPDGVYLLVRFKSVREPDKEPWLKFENGGVR